MSYAASAALQAALYGYLTGLEALSGIGIYDALPEPTAGALEQTFILIGPEEVKDASDQSGAGALHHFTLSILSDGAGFAAAKALAVTLSEALQEADLTLTRGRLVYLIFEKALARRLDEGSARRIDLTFVARIEL